jgi:UrcA family protein
MTTAIPARTQIGLLKILGAGAVALALTVTAVQAAPTYDEMGRPVVHVRYDDLNLASPEGTRALYRRIVTAARQVCSEANPLDMNQVAAAESCKAQAIERAVREVNDPRLAALHGASAKG